MTVITDQVRELLAAADRWQLYRQLGRYFLDGVEVDVATAQVITDLVAGCLLLAPEYGRVALTEAGQDALGGAR